MPRLAYHDTRWFGCGGRLTIHPWMSLHPLTIACLEGGRFPGIRQVRSLADWLTEQIKVLMGRRLPYLLLPLFPVPCSLFPTPRFVIITKGILTSFIALDESLEPGVS